MRVSFSDLGELRSSRMTNLGRGGLFVATGHPAPIGTRLTLRVSIAESGEEIELPAEVVCHNMDPSFKTRHGMGLRFRDLSPELEKKVDDLYESALCRAAERGRTP